MYFGIELWQGVNERAKEMWQGKDREEKQENDGEMGADKEQTNEKFVWLSYRHRFKALCTVKIQKKHSENADTSTSVTFDIDV